MAQGKKHEPTEETRNLVAELTGLGLTAAQVGRVVKISEPTLRKHYREELDSGADIANAQVARNLFRLAATSADPRAAIFWAKTRMRWRETDPEQKDNEITITLKDATPDRSATLGKGVTKRSKE